MEPTRKLRELWNWLPVFRAVAETEHLPTAAKALFVSPASLSRTIGLLEGNLGFPLFDRVGRNLHLNSSGKTLLNSVRNGMRAIDEGVSTVNGELWSGQINLWAQYSYSGLLLIPLIKNLQVLHPNVTIGISSHSHKTLTQQIHQGSIDIAITESPPRDNSLRVDVLQDIPYGFYCEPNHPLTREDSFSAADVFYSFPLIVTTEKSHSAMPDTFLLGLDKKVKILVENHSMAIQICRSTSAIAVLPCILAEKTSLVALAIPEPLPKAHLFAVYRKKVGVHPRTDTILEILKNDICPAIAAS